MCGVHTPETAAPIKRAGTSFIEMGSSETVLRASVVVSPHRRGGQRRYSKCVSAKQSARIFFTILVHWKWVLGMYDRSISQPQLSFNASILNSRLTN